MPALRPCIALVDLLQYCFDLGDWHTLQYIISLITVEAPLITHHCMPFLLSQFYFLHWALQPYVHAILTYTKMHCVQYIFTEKKKNPSICYFIASAPRTKSPALGTCSPLMCQTKVRSFVLLKMKSWLFTQFPMSHSTPWNYFWQI